MNLSEAVKINEKEKRKNREKEDNKKKKEKKITKWIHRSIPNLYPLLFSVDQCR